MVYKSIVGAVYTCLAAVSFNASAALLGGETLSFFDGVQVCHPDPVKCNFGFMSVTGSYFAFDSNGTGTFSHDERVAIQNANPGVGGITLGSPQNSGEIDLDWNSFGNDGRHATNTALGVPSVNVDGSVDMSGWIMTWDTVAVLHNLGNGAPAVIACTSGTFTCANGEEFTLDYTAIITTLDSATLEPVTGGLTTVPYQLHLEGIVVSSVPIPPAIWLFGSGLIGLLGIARKKKS